MSVFPSSATRCLALLLSFLLLSACSKREPQPPEAAPSKAAIGEASEPAPKVGVDQEPKLAQIAGLPISRMDAELQSETSRVDAAIDEWDSEVFSERALKQLKKLAAWLESSRSEDMPGIWAEGLTATVLRPEHLSAVQMPGGLSVRRWDEPEPLPQQPVADPMGRLTASLPSPDAQVDQAEFKIIGVNISDSSPETIVRVHLSGISHAPGESRVRFQQNLGYRCGWSTFRSKTPAIKSLALIEFEEIVQPQQKDVWFSDRTTTVFKDVTCFSDQLAYSLDHWRDRMDWRFGWTAVGPHGLAIGDVNGDGLDDIYVAETGGLPNRMLVQQPDGTLQDVSRAAGVDILEPTHGVLLVDLNNDGDQDLVAAVARYVLIFENRGGEKVEFFQHPTIVTRSMIRSISAADPNGDGRLDLFVCGYSPRDSDSIGLGRPLPYHDANNGAPNYFLQNEGSHRFRDVTQQVGLDENNSRFSYAAAWEDFDGDGDLDLYVANDFGRNNLYRNDGGRFRDVAAAAGVEDVAAGMSVCWGDYNRDGLLDLHVSNMFSSAGNRIAYQREFKPDNQVSTRAMYQRHARGNSLFENAGDGTFRDVSVEAHITEGRWAWGSLFADVNNDGWEDLIVANGMVTGTDDTGDL